MVSTSAGRSRSSAGSGAFPAFSREIERRRGMSFILKDWRTLERTAASEQASGSFTFFEYATGRTSRRNSSPARRSSQPPLQSFVLFESEYLTQIPWGKLEISALPVRTEALLSASPASPPSDPGSTGVPET